MHLAGGKITRSHTTAIDEAAALVKAADRLPEVKKIVLGVIVRGLPVGLPRLKCLPVTGGLRIEVRGTAAKQQLYVYTSDIEATESYLRKLFDKRR
jgi:hypothetical protein